MSVPSGDHTPLECDHGRRRGAIAEVLLHEVLHGTLGPGRHLVTRTLAERFHVSHTPIREALISLAGIGIVDLLPNRGAIVRRVSPDEVREICMVRRALECEAVRGACGRIDPDDLRILEDNLRRMVESEGPSSPLALQEARTLDSQLHDAIAGSCGNSFLASELGRLTLLFRAFRDASWEREERRNDYRRLGEEAREHLAIVDALVARDRGAAARAMSRHILSGRKYWCRSMPKPQLDPGMGRSRRRPENLAGENSA